MFSSIFYTVNKGSTIIFIIKNYDQGDENARLHLQDKRKKRAAKEEEKTPPSEVTHAQSG